MLTFSHCSSRLNNLLAKTIIEGINLELVSLGEDDDPKLSTNHRRLMTD